LVSDNRSFDVRVSVDGSRLIINDAFGFSTYRLPALRLERRISPPHTAAGVEGLVVVGTAGNVALVRAWANGGADDTAIAWNFVQGTAVASTIAPLEVLAVNPAGTVLRRTGPIASGPSGSPTSGGESTGGTPVQTACVRTVGIGAALGPAPGGVCGAVAMGLGRAVISPDSRWIMARATGAAIPAGGAPSAPPLSLSDSVNVASRYVLIRSDALDAGSYAPVPLPQDVTRVYGWVDSTRVLVSRSIDTRISGNLYVCGLDGRCAPVALPPDMPYAVPVFPPVPST
jgi:hypothetical protein